MTAVREVARETFVISLAAPAVAASVRPGQFVMLGLNPGPLLRRPFSVYRAEGDLIEVILKPVGSGTRLLLASGVVTTAMSGDPVLPAPVT